ncbi:transposase [Propionibacterium sp.]|uniref:transposase n=1 Tax=Propionibacterium sp. TaxID=1977903 RepID=UPI0039E8BD1B
MEAEMTEHLGHEYGGTLTGSNVRDGLRPKTVITGIDPTQIEVPRHRTTVSSRSSLPYG